jgi:hypothetical protein
MGRLCKKRYESLVKIDTKALLKIDTKALLFMSYAFYIVTKALLLTGLS